MATGGMFDLMAGASLAVGAAQATPSAPAADAGRLGIGVDSDQDGLFAGHLLTSMLKHVDVAVYKSFMDGKNGTWKPGLQVLGLKQDGVGHGVDPLQQGPAHARLDQGGLWGGRHRVGQDHGSRLHGRGQVPRLTRLGR